MHEFVTRGVVLSMEPSGEFDARYSLFTEQFGRIRARAKSVRKPTSKLAGHLQPGNLVSARFVETKGLQLVDAVKARVALLDPLDLHILDRILPETVPEPAVWAMFARQTFSWPAVLTTLGWDARHATCAVCHAPRPTVFHPTRQDFFCATCASRFAPDEVLLKY